MGSRNEETGEREYQRAFAALDELKLAWLKPFFKDNDLQDDTFWYMKSEEELKNQLWKELGLSYGQAFRFSRHWFDKYHKRTETLDTGLQLPQIENKPSHGHAGLLARIPAEEKKSNQPEPESSSQEKVIFNSEDKCSELLNLSSTEGSFHVTVDIQETGTDIEVAAARDDSHSSKCLNSPIDAGSADKVSKELPSTSTIEEGTISSTANYGHYAAKTVQPLPLNTCQSDSLDPKDQVGNTTTSVYGEENTEEKVTPLVKDKPLAGEETHRVQETDGVTFLDTATYQVDSLETLDTGLQLPQIEVKQSHEHAEKLPTSPRVLNEDSAQTQPPISTHVRYEPFDSNVTTNKQRHDEEGGDIERPVKEQTGSKHPLDECVPFDGGQLLGRIPAQKRMSNQPEPGDSSQGKVIFNTEDKRSELVNVSSTEGSFHVTVDIQETGTDIEITTARDDSHSRKSVNSPIDAGSADKVSKEIPSTATIEEVTISSTANDGHYAAKTVQPLLLNTCQSGSLDHKGQVGDTTTSVYGEENTEEKVTSLVEDKPLAGEETYRVQENDGSTFLDTTIYQVDTLDHSDQNARVSTSREYQEQSTNVIEGCEEDDNFNIPRHVCEAMEAQICKPEEKLLCKKVPIPPSESMGPDQGESCLSNANQEEMTNRIKPKEEIIQNKQNIGKHPEEDHASEDKNHFRPTGCDQNSNANTKMLGNGEDKTSGAVSGDAVSDLNNNSLRTASQTVTTSATNESLAAQEDRPDVNVRVNGSKTHLDSTGLTSADFGPFVKETANKLETPEDKTSDELRGNLVSDLTHTTTARNMNVFGTKELLAAKQDESCAEKAQHGTYISSRTQEKRFRLSPDEHVPIEPSTREGKPEEEGHQEVSEVVSKCTPRAFGVKGRDAAYQKGFVLDAEENREVEFKSFTSAQPSTLPWKIMEKAKKFICACLNNDSKGVIYFGVGDSQEQCSKFKRGEILGLDVEDVKDDIVKAFQFVLDDHIKSDAGPLQKGGEQNCVNIEFVPVQKQENRTGLCVIEIEVNRDWKFCKDNVYYCKSWAEKRDVNKSGDISEKKSLKDFYKVYKEQYDDVAIRTNGASTNVKKHEVNRQVKEPLVAKYKEWKRETKLSTEGLSEGPVPDDSDVKRFSALVKKRLRDLNFKDFGYVLIANKLPPQYRGTPNLAFLQNIPWLAVFDLFDAASKKDGLYYVCNETSDAPRAKLRSLDDFKGASPDWISDKSGKEFDLSTRGTTWILGNEEMQKGHWIKCARDCFYRALSSYKFCCPIGRLLCIFLGLDESNVQEMVDMMECCFSIFGDTASNCVTIVSESKQVTDAFIRSSKLQRELRECSITDIPWSLLKEIARDMIGPTKFEERGSKTELPYFTGRKEVFNKTIHSWDDLEVYIPNPRLPRLAEEIEKARNDFYRGTQASQTNLFHNHSIARTLEEETMTKIEQALKTLSKPSKDTSSHVITVTVTYEPGSGATTLCRRILWNKREEYRCAVVKAITPNTDYQIEQLQGIIYDENNFKFSPPCLVLVDNFPENETRRLTEKITKRQTKCVILSTFPIGKLNAKSDFDLTLRQLDEKEMSLVKDILINVTSDSKRRRGAEEVLEREKRFIWFGLELFGREYNKIEERLQKHIKSTLDVLDDSQDIHETILNFCCFLHYYSEGRAILPHPVVTDLLYETSNENEENCALMQHIHKIFGGLLLEGFDETNGYYGWRPAHSLVSEAVTSRINIEETAIALLEQIHKGKAYVNKFLKEQVFRVFLYRKRISDPVEYRGTHDESIDSDFENDVLGFYEVKTRYSPLILDILEGDDGIQGALRLLIKICRLPSEMEDKAYAWQQLARFIGYQMRANEIDAKKGEHGRLLTVMIEEGGMKKLPMPKTGIEAAHIAIDIAINQQPKYSHHYVTKGTLYLLQLRDFKSEERSTLPSSMPEVIDICRKALEVYGKASNATNELNYYSMIGKIQAILSLLEIVKGLPFFRLNGESITKYLKKVDIPREMEEVLTHEENSYIRDQSGETLGLLNGIFRDVKLRQITTYDDNAKLRASKLRRTYYEVTGFDRSQLRDEILPMSSQVLTRDTQAFYQQFVQDVLFVNDENTYSTWANLSDGDVSRIYKLLTALCSRGYGSHEDMLICCKACLRLQEKRPVEELEEIVSKWVSKFPDSEWAHLFNYMIHFPIPDKRLASFNQSAKESIKKCNQIVLNKTGRGFRKSGAEYFLGKGTGLYAIANSQQFRSLETKGEAKTEFWRSKEISERLERVCGQKDVNLNGVITYQGIQLRFDDTRYPKQSKDDLWFYVGFSLSGPYAYDPVDNDTYEGILKRNGMEKLGRDSSVIESTNRNNSLGAVLPRRENLYEVKDTNKKRGQQSPVTNIGDFPDLSISPLSKEQQYTSSSVPNLQSMLTSSPLAVPKLSENAAVSSCCLNTHAESAMSSWESTVNVHQLGKSSNLVSYASAVQQGGSPCRQQCGPRDAFSVRPVKGRKWKSIEGYRGMEKLRFTPKYVDEAGKLHHGAWVLGAKKSKECKIHTSEVYDIAITNVCSFAHSWRGDTLQYVCSKCTRANKSTCKERYPHESYIYELGPYRTEDGEIWKETRTDRPK